MPCRFQLDWPTAQGTLLLGCKGDLGHAKFRRVGLLPLGLRERLNILTVIWDIIRGPRKRRDGRVWRSGQSTLTLQIVKLLQTIAS
jgi:hypothetical protein